MHRFLAPLVLLTLLVAGLSAGTSTAAAVPDRDCGDFATQALAQTFFLSAGAGDPHRLDADGDGVVCESNPCPCIGSGQPVPLAGQVPTSPTATPTPDVDPSGSGNSGPVRRDWATVVRITDGDTLRVRLQGAGERSVRILGIDTPEVYGGRECGGQAASAHLARVAPVGSRVRLESDPSQADRDRYGRWLRYVAHQRLDVGREQIRRGLARAYVYGNDPFHRTRAYQRTEQAAHDRLRGSWGRCW